MLRICFYVTGHGLGHATRSVGLVEELLRLGHRVTIVTALAPDFFHQNLRNSQRNYECIQRTLDTGAIQTNPVAVDPLATLDTFLTKIHRHRDAIIETELAFLHEGKYDGIATDATGIVCTVGKLAGIPTVIVSNFTWDYVYREMLKANRKDMEDDRVRELESMVERYTADYVSADLFIRLPGETPLPPSFDHSKVVNAPLVCRKAKQTKEDMRKLHNISEDSKVLVLGFGGHQNTRRINFSDDMLPEGWICLAFGLSEADVAHTTKFTAVQFDIFMPDYINLADAVLGKIGYGTVSECVAHGTPLIYVPRSNWPEEVQVEGYLNSKNAGVRLSPDDFYNGHWKPSIDEAIKKKGSWNTDDLGADDSIKKVAEMLCSFLLRSAHNEL